MLDFSDKPYQYFAPCRNELVVRAMQRVNRNVGSPRRHLIRAVEVCRPDPGKLLAEVTLRFGRERFGERASAILNVWPGCTLASVSPVTSNNWPFRFLASV